MGAVALPARAPATVFVAPAFGPAAIRTAAVADIAAAVGQVEKIVGASAGAAAVAGSYQQMLQGKVYQMLRLSIDDSLGAIPEISANKYMLWVRFTSQGENLKPKALEDDVPFELTLCNF